MVIEHLFEYEPGVFCHLSPAGQRFFAMAIYNIMARSGCRIRHWVSTFDIQKWVEENGDDYAITLYLLLGGDQSDDSGSPERAFSYLYHRFLVHLQNVLADEGNISLDTILGECDWLVQENLF